ncbi:S-layer homology domain-containing protein [Cohnella suwonensis]|uniref:S-layer homology domain-containing protein n=1 Tax=Cohnella suwonensis TaxID=696072 RepID=A0ABW0LQN9_9BACL
MLFSFHRTKLLAVALVLLLLLTSYSPLSMAAESPQSQVSQAGSAASDDPILNNQLRYSDVPDQAWYAEVVNAWITLGMLKPKQGEKFDPMHIMTRGEFAYLLAYSLKLSPSKKPSSFKDLPDANLASFIEALKEEGLANGYPDGTFRPDLPVTRAEAASLLTKAKKLQPQIGSQFKDVPQKSWYAGAVGALVKAGIVAGKSKEQFAPNAVITKAESYAIMDRSFFSLPFIQDILDDGTIKIDGKNYRAAESLKGIFQPANKAALHKAAIQFTANKNTIESVEGLIIGYKSNLSGQAAPILFNAGGSTVNGFVTVSADHVMLANLEVKGDVWLTPTFRTMFMASGLHVTGKTVYLEDADRPKTSIANISFQNSDFGQLFLENSVYVKQTDLSAYKISHKSNDVIHTLSNDNSTVVQQLYVSYFGRTNNFGPASFFEAQLASLSIPTDTIPSSGDNSKLKASEPIEATFENMNVNVNVVAQTDVNIDTVSGQLNTVTTDSGANVQYNGDTPIGKLIINNSGTNQSGSTSFTSSVDIGQVTVNDNAGDVNLNVTGKIGSLEITGDNTQLDLGDSTVVTNLIVPSGVNSATIFVNDDNLASVKAVNGQSTAPVSTPQPTPTCDASGCH